MRKGQGIFSYVLKKEQRGRPILRRSFTKPYVFFYCMNKGIAKKRDFEYNKSIMDKYPIFRKKIDEKEMKEESF